LHDFSTLPVSHSNIIYNNEILRQTLGHTDNSVGVGWVPVYHDLGLIGNVINPLYVGGLCIHMSPIDFIKEPVRWLQTISRYRATSSGGPNFAYDLCVRSIPDEQLVTLDLSSWELAFSGAETVRKETIKKFSEKFKPCGFREEAFYPCYGMAEATLIISGGLKEAKPVTLDVQHNKLEKHTIITNNSKQYMTKSIVGCGRPWLDEEIYIVDPEVHTKFSDNKVGEIWVKGSNIAKGYWKKPEETKSTFNAYIKETGEGPFLRTGDLGFMVGKELFITGRLKDIIIINGRNFYPQDIENMIWRSHPALRQGCCAALSIDIEQEERLLVVQEVKKNCLDDLNSDVVFHKIRNNISRNYDFDTYAIVLLFPGTIPKTSSGKIKRYSCREKFFDGSLYYIEMSIKKTKENSEFSADIPDKFQSVKDIEQWLALKISQHFSIDFYDINLSAPLLDYGIDSREIVIIAEELGNIIEDTISPTVLTESSSITAIAQHIADVFLSHE